MNLLYQSGSNLIVNVNKSETKEFKTGFLDARQPSKIWLFNIRKTDLHCKNYIKLNKLSLERRSPYRPE